MIVRHYIYNIINGDTLVKCEENPKDGFASELEAYNTMREILTDTQELSEVLTIIKTYSKYVE